MKIGQAYKSASIEESNQIALAFSETISSESIVYLSGPIGSGKTSFATSIAQKFGVNEITSSSYSQVSFYRGDLNIVHCDFYRRSCDASLEIEPLLIIPWLLIVEWPYEKFYFNEKKSYYLNFVSLDLHTREIKLEQVN